MLSIRVEFRLDEGDGSPCTILEIKIKDMFQIRKAKQLIGKTAFDLLEPPTKDPWEPIGKAATRVVDKLKEGKMK